MGRRKQKEAKEKKKDSGSILIGIVIVFILMSTIAIAVINRTMQGAQLVTDSKKGYGAYQASDSNTEGVLEKIRQLDKADGKIPENTTAESQCGVGVCYKSDKTTVADKVADAFFVQKTGISQGLNRAIFAPLPDRITNPIANMAVSSGSPNRCNASVTLAYDSSTDWSDVASLQLRKSTSSALASGDWSQLTSGGGEVSSATNHVTINNSEFTYGSKYYFSIKAENKNPLQLDSLYFSPAGNLPSFAAPSSPSCTVTGALGCLSYHPDHSSVPTAAYSCCGGTECYVCDSGWKADSNNGTVCCTQVYKPSSCPYGVKTTGHENKCATYTSDVCNTYPH